MATSLSARGEPPSERTTEVPLRGLGNCTRDVMQLVEQGWTVDLTSHSRRFAELRPTAAPVAAPQLAALLAAVGATTPLPTGLSESIAATCERDRADPTAAPWR